MSGYFKDSKLRTNKAKSMKLTLGAALSFFMFTAFGAVIMLSSGQSNASTQPSSAAEIDPDSATVPALIPMQAISPGSALEPLMFRIEQRPRSSLQGKVLSTFEQVTGLYAKSLIIPNHPLLADYTTNTKPINQVTKLIPEGYRGVTIRVDERSGIEGWARAGSRVDVTWTSNVVGKPAITTIVQNTLVISAGRNVNGDYPADSPAPAELTLLVTKDDARRIILGQTTGILSLSLRGSIESGKGDANTTITTDDLLGIRRTGAPRSVRIIVVGVQNDEGIYEYFHWDNEKLVPTSDKGTFPH